MNFREQLATSALVILNQDLNLKSKGCLFGDEIDTFWDMDQVRHRHFGDFIRVPTSFSRDLYFITKPSLKEKLKEEWVMDLDDFVALQWMKPDLLDQTIELLRVFEFPHEGVSFECRELRLIQTYCQNMDEILLKEAFYLVDQYQLKNTFSEIYQSLLALKPDLETHQRLLNRVLFFDDFIRRFKQQPEKWKEEAKRLKLLK